MPKRDYTLAIACYVAIPIVVVAGGVLFALIDPELARGRVTYERDYRVLQLVQNAALMVSTAAALLLAILCCYFVVKSRDRSLGWLSLVITGPIGFMVIAALDDRSPKADNGYQRFIAKLPIYARIVLEGVLFIAIVLVAYEVIELKRDLMIRYQSWKTGVDIATIIAEQNASSGMWAFGEGLELLYLIMFIYLVRPLLFNLASQPFKRRVR